MTHLELPADPLARFVDIYAALNAERGRFEGASALRFAAMSAMCCPGDADAIAVGIRDLGEEIKAGSRWFGDLRSELRFIVAAMLLLSGDDPEAFLEEVKRVREMFRAAALRRGGIYETMAILIMRIRAEGAPITPELIERFKAIYEEMKRHHWWLTGPDDFPACGILVGRPETPGAIGEGTEAIYQALRESGFSTGDPLQSAANILFLADVPATELARRYRSLADGFNAKKIAIWQSDYDELAILSFLDHTTSTIVDKVVEYRARMEELKPRPDRSLTFNLAASIAFMDLVRLDPDLRTITDAKALMDMQAIMQAQQAAAIAAASTAAVVAASSSASS